MVSKLLAISTIMLVATCLSLCGEDTQDQLKGGVKVVYRREMGRGLVYSMKSKGGDTRSRRVFATPPPVVYWVTSTVQEVIVIPNFDSASSDNDKAVMKFDTPVRCGDSTQTLVTELQLYFNNNKRAGGIVDDCDFMPGDLISLGFSSDGELYDFVCPVDPDVTNREDWIKKIKSRSGGTPEEAPKHE